MPAYIVLRLTPPTPVSPATFSKYLDGLTVSVFDASYAHPKAGMPGDPTPALGTAAFFAPSVSAGLGAFPIELPLPAGTPLLDYPAGTGIVQHYTYETGLFSFGGVFGLGISQLDFYSVATAVIAYTPPGPEYPGPPIGAAPDLRIQFSRGGAVLADPDVYYNAFLLSDPANPYPFEQYQSVDASHVAAYVDLPPALDPNLAQLLLPANGAPPNYDALLAAVNKVLAADPGGQTLASLAVLGSLPDADQCRNIAYEILWGPQPALPTPPEALEQMYSQPPNSGNNTDSNEQARQDFRGKLKSHYSILNAQADLLGKFVFTLACAVWCEQHSQQANRALFRFPTDPGVSTPLTTVSQGEVLLTGALGMDVPAPYFYALAAQLPAQVSMDQRYLLAGGAGQQFNLGQLQSAVDAGTIGATLPVNPAQAVRVLEALSAPAASTSTACPVADIQPLWQDWLNYPPAAAWRAYHPGDDEKFFWPLELAKPAPVPGRFLHLVLWAVTEGSMDGVKSLADSIAQGLPVSKVGDLTGLTTKQWTDFFELQEAAPAVWPNNNVEARLPGFTLPGTADARIAAFIRHVQKFFRLAGPTGPGAGAADGAPPSLDLPAPDLIQAGLAPVGVSLGIARFTPAQLALIVTAAQTLLPGDVPAQNWLVQTVVALNDLALCAAVGKPSAFQYSLMESLYARGFTSIDTILEHRKEDFRQALTGTVAYADADAIYTNALNAGTPPQFLTASDGTFHPVNDGSLVNCVPPCFLSPLSPVGYLHDMLRVSTEATCEFPFLPAPAGQKTLAQALEERRGPLGKLAVTCANLETPLPLIDLVNECLESMAAGTPTSKQGAVYDTAEHELAKHRLCQEECCSCKDDDGETLSCHAPATLFAALPEHSTPATPTADNAAVEPAAFNRLKEDFSTCGLPYSQALDVARTYLGHFRTCRFEAMRTFRKCITEFVLDPAAEPAGFQSHLWRYPVRVDIAIEYVGITPEEYEFLFAGQWPRPCAATAGDGPAEPPVQRDPVPPRLLREFMAGLGGGGEPGQGNAVPLPAFLAYTCLSYCEFLELWKSGFVPFRNVDDRRGAFPDCEPCCPETLRLTLDGEEGAVRSMLGQLLVFIRLWRKLQDLCGARYSFAQLRDICEVLHLFVGGSPNPDFIRQLAAFQMLRDQLRLRLSDPAAPPASGATGADRTHLLALWDGKKAGKWDWAVDQLLAGIAHHAQCRHKCRPRSPEFIKLLAVNLDELAPLAGFDPGDPARTWQERPTHTLRFVEILAKIYASDFRIGEVLYLFTADTHLDGEDPFPLQEQNDAEDHPLGLPDEDREHALWRLRQKMLAVHVSDDEAAGWTWERIEAFILVHFDFASGDLLSFAQHFFPDRLAAGGQPATAQERRYVTALPATATPVAMWNTPPLGPFRYDAAAQQLWTELPFNTHKLVEQLTHVRPLNAQERQAVQDLYFQPRAKLAALAFLFTDFTRAERHLLEERDERARWAYFQRQIALCQARCRLLEEHLSRHVVDETCQDHPEAAPLAALVLRGLFADENKATADWENDAGDVPPMTWTPLPNGGAYAALLGLVGTGLTREVSRLDGTLVWRDVSGSLSMFGTEENAEDIPVPTVLPSLDLKLTSAQEEFVRVLNGFVRKDADDELLGGGEGFAVRWSGALLIEHEGRYEFSAGAPTPDGEEPALRAARHRKWRVVLTRGQKTWVLLNHQWEGESCHSLVDLPLRRGAYGITVEFVQPSPVFLDDDELCVQRTGFQLKYRGPDSHDIPMAIPHDRLFQVKKDATLGVGIAGLAPAASAFLAGYYTSSLRDIRRTYQRAFKAVLLAHRFALSAKRMEDGHSELGYLLSHPKNFAGASYYKAGAAFTRHAASFDFNFLPLLDNYYPPDPAVDHRVKPSLQREQAMFDWWERLYDYVQARHEVRGHCNRHLWLLFDEADEKLPAHPGYLLRHLCADSRHWEIDLRYYQDQTSPVYHVTSVDLSDDRWVVRAWHADRWLNRLRQHFRARDITRARPDLWASLDPSAPVSGETETGNANLSTFLLDGCLEKGEPRLYAAVKQLNDGLRERGRHALVAYLCRPGGIARTAKDLSDLLLLDVETGLCEKASRIDEAISAVQAFVQRARLGLEPGWKVGPAFARVWDLRFASFRVWETCKRRELYKENQVDWDDLENAGKVEAFGFLNDELRRMTLTIAVPGGVDYWPGAHPPVHGDLCLLQRRDPARMGLLTPSREGLNLLATPDRAARPTWLTAVPGQPPPAIREPDPRGLAGFRPPAAAATVNLPFWMQSALDLGKRFLRVAAANYPSASTSFRPRPLPAGLDTKEEKCVECCCDCGCGGKAHVDEYYIWLVDCRRFEPGIQPVYSGNFDAQQTSYYDPTLQEATPWHDPTKLPDLLSWPSEPMVRLAWCRVRHGEFGQPRLSDTGIDVPPASVGAVAPDLAFLGRAGDSLYFSVTNAVTASQPQPGFRYDLADDQVFVSPNLTLPPVSPGTYPGGLSGYPYFAYADPGARLFPWSMQTPALAVADGLRAHCRFEAALKWYQLAYDPLEQDNTWIRCLTQGRTGREGIDRLFEDDGPAIRDEDGGRGRTAAAGCCDSTDVPCRVARRRSILLHYIETMVQWADVLLGRGTPEASQQARLLLDTASEILGKRPRTIVNTPPAVPQTVADFSPLFASLNPRLLKAYDQVANRLGLIHRCHGAKRLRNSEPVCCLPYFGHEGAPADCCDVEGCRPASPYRFEFLVQKARELAGRVKEFGGMLLTAIEKGDTEYLASMRARHEREMLVLGREIRKDQWRDADWQVQALIKTKESDQASRRYYAQLIQNGLNNNELQYVALTQASMQTRATSIAMEGVAETMDLIPDMFVGFPCEETWLPLGTKLAGMFKTIARITNTTADIQNTDAGLHNTEAGWDRRLQEWTHQVEVLDIQIEQVELQILGAQRRRDQSLRELNNQETEIQNSTDILDRLRDKFSNQATYLWMQKEMAALHRGMYELALYSARQAEAAFLFERRCAERKFVAHEIWDDLHEGLLAGERLELYLSRMERAYLDLNVREYELTKHISLRQAFPFEFLRLKLTGVCEIEIPEWMFDLDYPGQYMRRIKNVSLTLPCVTGPYTGVHCRATLLCSRIRVDAALQAPAAHCCSEGRSGDAYSADCHDSRMVFEYGAREAMATSGGQNDTGLFELNFRDERYLPFEFHGGISRWRIELPPGNNYFDTETLSDLVMHMNYTAREGGAGLRDAASEAARKRLPGSGWVLLDLRHDYPDIWENFGARARDPGKHRQLGLRLKRKMFPWIPGHPAIEIEKIALLFEVPPTGGEECPHDQCACPEQIATAGFKVKYVRHEDDGCECEQETITCVRSQDWAGLYYGSFDPGLGRLGGEHHSREISLRFSPGMSDVHRAYVFCRYRTCRGNG